MHKSVAQKMAKDTQKSLLTPSIPSSPKVSPSAAWNAETPALSARHKTSGQIFLQNWLQTQAEVDTPQRCNEPPWNNELTPGNPPRPIRRLSFPSLTPPGVSFSVGSVSTSSRSIEIARGMSSQIPGDFDLSGEQEPEHVVDFNDFSCIAQALKDSTFSGLSSYGSQYYDDEPLNFEAFPFLSATHAQMDQSLKMRTEIASVDTSEAQDSDGSFGDCSCDSDGPTPVTTFPRDSGACNTTDMALEMLSIIASLDTITVNKLHRLFSIAGQGDMTVAVERLQKHVRPRNDLPSLFAGSTLQGVYSQPVESVMVSEVTPLLPRDGSQGESKDDSKSSTWQRVKRRVSHSFKI
ncbi:hypothetical protein CJU89_4663 [Yarrowia sp. B02]|nr:hypothetical protein CJU89_4663 [Yarrowia sp. B02]